MASSRVRAKYNLARDVRKSDNILKTSAMRAQEQNEAAADSSFWGRLGGMGVGTIAGLALAPFTGGASLAVTAGLAGLGSYAGSKAGEAHAGGIDQDVKSGGFGIDKVSDMNRELASYAKGVEQDRTMNMLTDAFSVYMAGGGGMTPSTLGKGTGAFSKMGARQLGSGIDLFTQQAKQLITGGAKNYAKSKGFDTIHEAYMNRDKQ